jgi:hypothetical protein
MGCRFAHLDVRSVHPQGVRVGALQGSHHCLMQQRQGGAAIREPYGADPHGAAVAKGACRLTRV